MSNTDKPLYKVNKQSVIDVKIAQPFAEIVDVEFHDNTQLTNVMYTMSWSFYNQDNYTPYMLIPDAILNINNLQALHDEAVKIRLRVTVPDNGEYNLTGISINEISISKKLIEITDSSDYRFNMRMPDNVNLFKPYADMQTAIDLQYMMVDGVNRVFSHTCVYYKADTTAVNHTFKSIEHLKVNQIKWLKYLVPDNDFKSNQIVYAEHGIAYDESLEIHITVEEFQQKFGSDQKPEALDYFIIPELSRIYEVTAVQGLKLFMHTITHYVVYCRKYEFRQARDESSDDKSLFNIDTIRDFNVDRLHEPNNPDQKSTYDENRERIVTDAFEESMNSMKEHMYYDVRMHDSFRQYMHIGIKHNRLPLCNGTVKMSVAQYNFNNTPSDPYENEIAILYRNRFTNQELHRSAQFWFNWTSDNDGNLIQIDKLRIGVRYNSNNFLELCSWFDPEGENQKLHSFQISKSTWYNIVIQINLDLRAIEIELRTLGNTTTIGKPSLTNMQSLAKPLSEQADLFDSGQVSMLTGTYFMTNLRVYTKLQNAKQIIENCISPAADTLESMILDNCPVWETQTN